VRRLGPLPVRAIAELVLISGAVLPRSSDVRLGIRESFGARRPPSAPLPGSRPVRGSLVLPFLLCTTPRSRIRGAIGTRVLPHLLLPFVIRRGRLRDAPHCEHRNHPYHHTQGKPCH
jgi:hypothetical protein